MQMKARQTDGTAAIDQAIEWIERLQVSDGDSEAFFDWLTDSPRHVEVFIQTMTLEHRLAAIAPEQWAAWDAAAGANGNAQDALTNVVPLSPQVRTAAKPAPKRGRWPIAVAASAVMIAVGGGYFLHMSRGWQDFTTAIGEQRAIRLADGSIIDLNTDSHVRVHLSAGTRDIQLLAGEALFKVQHDAVRPFRVHTGDTVIQAVGTQFDVYRQPHHTTVSVLEGRVRVSSEPTSGNGRGSALGAETRSARSSVASTALSAGEQADVGRDGQIKRRASLNVVHVTAWQQRRLIFDEERLANIISEFNRYNRRHFRVEGLEAEARRFSGIFDADDPESLAQLLARDNGLIVQHADDEILIRARTPDGVSGSAGN